MSEEEFSTILEQHEVTSPHLETQIVIYLQRNSNISTPGKPWNKGDSLTKPTFWVDFETECHFFPHQDL